MEFGDCLGNAYVNRYLKLCSQISESKVLLHLPGGLGLTKERITHGTIDGVKSGLTCREHIESQFSSGLSATYWQRGNWSYTALIKTH